MSRLPEPLPPAERPVGQLVGETLKLYGRRFWASLLLGVPVTAAFAIPQLTDNRAVLLVLPLVVSALFALSYVGAVALAAGRPIPFLRPFLGGFLVFLPFQFLALVILPGLAWLAAFGLVVPVLALERPPFGAAFGRAFRLARADFIHAFGALAALFVVATITWFTMTFALRDFGEQGATAASAIAILIVGPAFFLGMALLYFDQEARENRRRVPRR